MRLFLLVKYFGRCLPRARQMKKRRSNRACRRGGNKSYPDLFQAYGGFPDSVRLQDGHIIMPEIPGIGLDGKSERRACGWPRTHAVLGTSAHCIATYPGDFAQALIALDAAVEITGKSGVRRVPFAELHKQPGNSPEIETVLVPGELISAFSIAGLSDGRNAIPNRGRCRTAIG